jgi:hypothetical protein
MFMIRDKGHREHVSGQADLYDEPRIVLLAGAPATYPVAP